MRFTLKTKGDFRKAERYLRRKKNMEIMGILYRYGMRGVSELSQATPMDTGLTAGSWYYEIEKTKRGYVLGWNNSNLTTDNTPIAILLQYGHGTGGGTYVQGTDYVNPALAAVVKNISEEIWKEVLRG